MKQTITLFSLEPKIYPNLEVEVELIEDISKVINDITEPEIIKAQKTARVQARYGKYGEKVDTRPRVEVDGKIYTFLETQKTISLNDIEANKKPVIVKNPDGEEYIISSYEKFAERYKASGTYDLFDPIENKPRKFKVSNGNYAFMASWGEPQIILKGSLFCIDNPNKIYGVTNSAFKSTYKVVEKELPNEFGE